MPKVRIAAIVTLAALLAGCSSISDHRGYIADEALVQAVQPGIDNRESVEGTLGRPTFASEFGNPIWYYVSS
ncbi:MAG TPA: outer membrane protein assembly factor BamE, partial [Sphingomonadaceae bacterium]|nr:outer membrane protein assembly factor BamE [Sphingomonadaceae bacterium]